MFASHFTTNSVLNVGKKYFALPLIKENSFSAANASTLDIKLIRLMLQSLDYVIVMWVRENI